MYTVAAVEATCHVCCCQVLRRKYGKEADIWSCGVMLYILLSGMPPFYGDNEQQIFDSILRNKVDFESDPWPKVSEPAKVSRQQRCWREDGEPCQTRRSAAADAKEMLQFTNRCPAHHLLVALQGLPVLTAVCCVV